MSEFQMFFEQNSGLVALTIVCMFVQLVRIILMFYTSMAIGGSATRHKLFYSLLTFIVIVIICSIISAVCNLHQFTNLFHDTVQAYENSLWVKMCLRELITDIIYSVVFFGLTQVFLKRKLNLE